MLKIKDDVDLKELEKFWYEKFGGTQEEHYYWGFYHKEINTLFNKYKIKIYIQGQNMRKIVAFRNLALDESFKNVEIVEPKKKWIRDLIQAGLVEKVGEWNNERLCKKKSG